MDALRLPLNFNPVRLEEELDLIDQAISWHAHPDSTVAKPGNWTAVALIGPPGTGIQDEKSLRYRGDAGVATSLLKLCPYMRQVIESFRTDIHRARLMSLRPGADIAAHRDYGHQRYSIERGFIRVHIPVRSHELVSFTINGARIPMQPGEAWYTNVCEPHAVKNDSAVHRVHLVLDMSVNDWVLSMFPRLSPWVRIRGAVLQRHERRFNTARFAAAAQLLALKRLAGDLGLRRLRNALRAAPRVRLE